MKRSSKRKTVIRLIESENPMNLRIISEIVAERIKKGEVQP